MAETITYQGPKIKTQRSNKQPVMAAEERYKEIVGREAVIKGLADKEDFSIKRQTFHQYKHLRVKWKNLTRF